MGDLAVRRPHLGRETIALLGRIVDSQDAGLPQDDIEPYLLVRLLRCAYVRRKETGTPVFVVTQAGVERSRFEGDPGATTARGGRTPRDHPWPHPGDGGSVGA